MYGFGVDARSTDAIARLLALKGRDEGRGISVLVASLDAASPLLRDEVPAEARVLAEAFWPGPLTIVLPAAARVPAAIRGPGGGVGLRCSSDPVASELVRRFGAPVTSTSANRSGEEPARSAAQILAAFDREVGDGVLHVLDAGERRSSEVSTVVAFADGRASVLRAGAVSAADLASVLALPEEDRG